MLFIILSVLFSVPLVAMKESHRISTHNAASVDNQPLNHLLTPEEKMREEAITLSLNIKKDDEQEEESNLDLDLKL